MPGLEPRFFGPLFMVGLPGPRVDQVARELVRDLQVGGVALFARNLEDPQQVWQLTHDLQKEALAAAGRPLFIALDQEGGTVQRLKAPFTIIPSAHDLGLEGNGARVAELARRTARELALVGINMNLAPVLDVARGPDCPQWSRSYGPDPERVADLGAAAIRGYLEGGVIPVAKHFPGLGDTHKDSHVDLPRAGSLNASREADLLPFQRAIAAGAPAVMTAHLVVPSWDERPATLSPVILQEWLRGRLGFTGVIITDDLEMGAIAGRTPAPEAAVRSLAAGADLLLICNNWQAAWEAGELMARDGQMQARGEEAGARLTALRKLLPPQEPELQAVKAYFARRR